MKICRYNDNRLGLVEGDKILDVTAALDELPVYKYPFPRTDQLIANLEMLKPKMAELAKGAASIPLALDVARKDGRVKNGDLLLFEAMGGGFTWGSALVRW